MQAATWHSAMPAPRLQRAFQGGSRSTLARFRDINPEIHQPGLSDHVIAIHLGGAKRIHQWHAGGTTVHDVEQNSITVMPAFESNRWITEGCVDFAHVSVSPGLVAEFVSRELDRDPRTVTLAPAVGRRDPFLAETYCALLRETEDGFGGPLYAEALMTCIIVAAIRDYSNIAGTGAQTRRPIPLQGGLAGWQLRRAVDHLNDNLGGAITCSDLTAITGLSRSHFFLAFRQSTGVTPHHYLNLLRTDQAKSLLTSSAMPVVDIGAAVGYPDARRFARWFRRMTGTSPKALRKSAGQP